MNQVRNDENSFHPPGRITCTCTRWKRPRWRRKGTTETVNTRHLLREVKKPWTWMLPGIPLAPVNWEFLLCLHFDFQYQWSMQCMFGQFGQYYIPGEQHRSTMNNVIYICIYITTQNNNVFMGSMLRTVIWVEASSTAATNIWWNSHWHGTLSGLSDCTFLSM